MPQDNYRSQHRYKVWINEFPAIFFTTLSGGDTTTEVTQVHPGNREFPVNIPGPVTIEQLTLGKPYDSIKDNALIAWARAWDRGVQVPVTVVKQAVNAAGIPDGPRTSFLRCAKVTLNEPDVGRGSAEAAMLELTLQPEQVL
ncbi:MAG: phage tail protein [Myxococcota bacterium]